jgi:hypothetical protein
MTRKVLLAAGAALVAAAAMATVELPRVSPAASVSLKVGTTPIEVKYSRPGVKGRTIWGGLVPYDQIWRLGANEATTIMFGDDVKVAGQELKAGTYALFAVPGKESWTFLFNSQADQWGAFTHDAAKDVLKIEVKPEQAPEVEWMRFTIDPLTPQSAEVTMSWAGLRVGFPVEVDVPAVVWGQITKELQSASPTNPDSYRDYYLAAQYSLQQGGHAEEALEWADHAMKLKPGYRTYALKARLLARAGKFGEAIPLMQKAIAEAGSKAEAEMVDGMKKDLADWEKQR